MNQLLRIAGVIFIMTSLHAQEMGITYIRHPIEIDGKLNEAEWSGSQVATNFTQFFPYDTALANSQTEIRLLYDDEFLYMGAKMYNLNDDRNYVTPSLRRDFRGSAFDGISIVIDPFLDKTNAFIFGINPYGVRREGLISNGNDFSLDWDNVWYGEAHIEEGFWTAELAIPFKTLRFKKDQDYWNMNFYRLDSEDAERSAWTPVPRNFQILNLAFTQPVYWEEPTGSPGTNMTVIPFLAGGVANNFEDNTGNVETFGAGFDMKYGITPALNLDLTVFPDFSQVEVDRQVTNLDRFEIFFPERRQFFLENADLFSDFGFSRTTPFFSRRIGVAIDTSTGQNLQNSIPFGARLSGKITNNSRIGVLNMQAGRDDAAGVPGTNYSVLAFQQKVFNRSNVGVILINKHSFLNVEGEPNPNNTVFGLDYNLATANNKWTGKAFYHQSVDNTAKDSTFSTGITLNYSTINWNIEILGQSIGKNFNPETGFVRRRNINRASFEGGYTFFPDSRIIQGHGPVWNHDITWNETMGMLDYDFNAIYQFQFQNTSSFSIRWRREFVRLTDPFDPSGTGGLELLVGTDNIYDMMMVFFESDNRKKFFWDIYGRFGSYFGGGRTTLQGSFNYRYQPYGFTSLNFSYNRINLPDPYNDANLLLIGPRFDFTFTKKLFWTTFVQYNNQINNLNINSRLQWRYKPVSDLFLVYTDNYFAESFDGEDFVFLRIGAPKSRAIVIKWTYWLNI